MKAVILAGGSGTRLWPISRSAKPKQFSELVGQETLIQDTYRRLLRLFPKEDIYFSVSAPFDELIKEAFLDVSPENIFLEPERRDTGPAMGYVATRLSIDFPDEPVVFVPSDHYIRDEERFLQCLTLGERLILETGKLVDIGIRPTFPSTALGYTHVDELLCERNGIRIHNFLGHTEKPAYPVAKAYLEDGTYLWHANYYMWTPRKFMEAFHTHAPQMGGGLEKIKKALEENNEQAVIDIFKELPKISIDYAVTEYMGEGQILVIEGDFGWSDIGAWDTLHDQLSENKENVSRGLVVAIDTVHSLIYGQKNKITAVLGMDGVVVVDTEDALLVCNRQDSQRVKEIVQHLSEKGHDKYL